MKDQAPDKVKVEMARLERQKPFIQPFKALNTWKDSMEANFDVRLLVGALMSIERKDLAEKVLDILDNSKYIYIYVCYACYHTR
jgi:hypothetical protein